MSFGSRLKARREQLGITQVQLAQMLGVTKGAVGNYETEVSSPKADILYRVFDVLQCDANYLFQDEMNTQEEITASEMEHIKKYRTLDGYGKKMIDLVLNLEIQRLADLADNEPFPNVIELPLFDQPASAGYGNWIDEVGSELIPVPDTPTTRRADFCVRVSGDSMEPRYSDGDLVFVRQQDDVPVGDFGIWVIDGSAYIKQRAVSTLHSLNPNYEDVVRGENVFCVGKVIGKM